MEPNQTTPNSSQPPQSPFLPEPPQVTQTPALPPQQPSAPVSTPPAAAFTPTPNPNFAQPSQKSSRKKLKLILALVALLALVAGSISVYAFVINRDDTVTTTKTQTGTGGSDGGSATLTGPVTTTEDCGSEDCFYQKFKSCSKSTLTATSPLGSVYYEIHGPKEKGCEVLLRYTDNPNPDWINKDFICQLDAQKSLEDEIVAAIGSPTSKSCTGALVAEIQKLQSPSEQ